MLRPPSFATRGRELWRVDGLGDVHLACVPRPLWQVRVGRKRHSEKRKGRGGDGEEFAGTGGQGGRGVRARGAGDPVTRAWRGADQGEGVRDLLQRPPVARSRRKPLVTVRVACACPPPRVKKGGSGWVPGPARAQRSLLEVLSVHT